MSAIAPPHELTPLVTLARVRTAAPTPEAAPCAPIGWLRGRLLPLSHLWWLHRLVYRLFRLPALVVVHPEGEVRVLDIANLHYTRDRAARLCLDRDDFVLGVEYEAEQGARPRHGPTFSRPRCAAYTERESEDAALYTGDLRECVEMTLAAENVRLRRRLALYDEHLFGIVRDVDDCRETVRHL